MCPSPSTVLRATSEVVGGPQQMARRRFLMRSKYVVREAHAAAPLQGPQLVRWGSVCSGTIIAIAVFALLIALSLALSFGSHVSSVYSNLSWWVGGTAIFCM